MLLTTATRPPFDSHRTPTGRNPNYTSILIFLPFVFDRFIANPSTRENQACHLILMQSLLLELGLLTERKLLPQTIGSAKKFIKKHVFVSIKEYLAKRNQGQAVVKESVYSSKSVLVRNLKQKKDFVSPAWVKERGLQDLLVTAFRRQ